MGMEAPFYLSRKGLAKNTLAQGIIHPTWYQPPICIATLMLSPCSCMHGKLMGEGMCTCISKFNSFSFEEAYEALDRFLGFGIPYKVAIEDHTETPHHVSLHLGP